MVGARHLLLLRHAKSSWDDPTVADHDRPLAARGRKAATLIGTRLRADQTPIDLVLCSSARRAHETLDLVAPPGRIEIDNRLYGASVDELLQRVRRIPDEVKALMLIGHNPALHDLAVDLLSDPGRLAVAKFPTGALATLTFTGSWRLLAPQRAELVAFIKPRDLG